MSNWREEAITLKQAECISNMQEFSSYPLPLFMGTTKGEASDYIDRYGKLAHESTWGIENGYE